MKAAVAQVKSMNAILTRNKIKIESILASIIEVCNEGGFQAKYTLNDSNNKSEIIGLLSYYGYIIKEESVKESEKLVTILTINWD